MHEELNSSTVNTLSGTKYKTEVLPFEPRKADPWINSQWRKGLSEQQQQAFDLAHEWFFNKPDAPFVLTGFAGTGKLQPLDEPVLTPNGWVRMGDIKKGDFVISADGKPTTVLETFPHKNADIWRVCFDDGTWTECHDGHLWRVQTKKQTQNGNYQVLPLSAMLPLINQGARKTAGGHNKGYAYYVDCCMPVHFNDAEIPIHPYLMGWLLGDGYLPLSTHSMVSISTWAQDSEEIAAMLDECLTENVVGTLRNPSPSNLNVKQYTISCKIKDSLKTLGLLGVKSKEKFVPKSYLFNSIPVRKAILAGLLDTDGSVSRFPSGKVKVRFSTRSSQLANDVMELTRSLGGKSSVVSQHRKNGADYSVCIRLPFNPFRLSRKAETYGDYQPRQRFKKSIVKAEYIGKKDGQCIAVDHPDCLYLTRDYIVTHNSFSVQRIVHSIQKLCLSNRKFRVALCAPTHKARSVLENFAASAELRWVHITTLHSLLHIMPGKADENGKTRLEVNPYSQEPHYREFNLVIVDEASMIGEELLGFIPTDIPTIFMGDRAQLPPVENEQDGEPQDSPIFGLPCGVNLTQVMRYDGVIAKYATALRQDINAQFPPRINSSGNLTKIRDKTQWELAAINAFARVNLKECPDDVRVLAWTNKRVAELNKLIRNTFFDSEQEFCEGERLMAKEPIVKSTTREYYDREEGGRVTKAGKEVLMQTCAECTITTVKSGEIELHAVGQTLWLKSWILTVITDLGADIDLTVVARSSWDEVKTFIFDYKKSILACEDRSERRDLWRDYYQILELLNLAVKGNALLQRLQYAFALTIHQSQGSTFKHVLVDQNNVFGCRHPKTRNQLLYVSATRASEHLTIYSKV